MSLDAAVVKNRAGYIVEAIRENYQDAEVQKARQLRAEKVREKELQELTEEFKIKRQNLLRQAVHADPANWWNAPPNISIPTSSGNGFSNTTRHW